MEILVKKFWLHASVFRRIKNPAERRNKQKSPHLKDKG